MCGICGFTGLDDSNLLKRMTEVMVHRGPDEYGYYHDGNIALGHRRLSIIDLTTGTQPIYNEDKSVVVVYNGEIYNFKELRKDLEAKNHKFRTNSDTEVIVHMYEEEKEDCVNRFNGEFAFAIWDNKLQKLILARDRFGIKPLYYAILDGNIFFASEIKSLLQYGRLQRDINYRALDHYITLRYTVGEETLFDGVRKLLPGTILIYDKDKRIKYRKYWNMSPGQPRFKKEGDYIHYFKDLFSDSVKMRLTCDVPFGAYLSGGIDSSAIVALMGKNLNNPVNTFSIGFNTEKDEFSHARCVSEYLHTNHEESMVKSEDFKLLPKVLWHLDEPLGDAIIVPTYKLAQMAAKKVKMVFSGEGADELFGSYIHQETMYMADIYNKVFPDILKFGVFYKMAEYTPLSVFEKLFNYPASLGMEGKTRFLEFLRNIKDKTESYLNLVSLFNKEDKELLYTRYLKEKLETSNDFLPLQIKERLENSGVKNYGDRLILNEFNTWLPGNILFKQDKITMANSLEARVPYLDHRLVEFMLSVPNKLRMKGLNGKYLLRRAVRGELPSNIVKRKKQAFFIPMEKRFMDIIMNMSDEFLSRSSVEKRNLFDYNHLSRIINNIEKSPFIFTKQLISVIILEMWFRIYIDNESIY